MLACSCGPCYTILIICNNKEGSHVNGCKKGRKRAVFGHAKNHYSTHTARKRRAVADCSSSRRRERKQLHSAGLQGAHGARSSKIIPYLPALPASPAALFLCTFVLFGCFKNLIHVATSIRCSLNHYLAKYAPERHILPSWGRPGEHPPGRKVLRSGCAGLHPAAKVESVLKVEPKSKRSQSRMDILCLKVE